MSEYILRDIRQALGYEEDDTSHDDEITEMSSDEQFKLYCQWNGLLGWHYKLRDVVLELFSDEATTWDEDFEQGNRPNRNSGPLGGPFGG